MMRKLNQENDIALLEVKGKERAKKLSSNLRERQNLQALGPGCQGGFEPDFKNLNVRPVGKNNWTVPPSGRR